MKILSIILVVVIPIISMGIYILLKETTIFGKRYNDNYETDVTRKLGYKVWTFMWMFTCLLSAFFSFTRNDWGGKEFFLLVLGTTLLFVILLSIWTIIRKRSGSSECYSYLRHSPDDLFNLLGWKLWKEERTEIIS